MMRPDVPIGMEVTLFVGCPIRCEYCPTALLNSKYHGARVFTLDSFKRALDEIGRVPVSRNLTFMGHADPYLCKDATKIMRWALQERGHMGSVSTILQYCSFEDIDALAEMKDRLTDTVVHCPANDNLMTGLKVDDSYVEKFKYAIKVLRSNPDFTLQVYNTVPHPAIHKIWADSGIPIPCYGLHDRAGHLPNLNTPFIKHGPRTGAIPLCGKQFCGCLWPNGDLGRCCNDWAMENVWGNLFRETYYDCYHTPAFRSYIKSLQDPNSTPRCRTCHDSYHQVNVEDRNKGYDLVGH
jgi:hypothetical protein